MDNSKQKSASCGSFREDSVSTKDEEEEGELSSSGSQQLSKSTVEDELVHFRAKWQQEIQAQPKAKEHQTETVKKHNFTDDSTEAIARDLFIKGIELERLGKLYEAIQFYRKAVQLVPDIEYKLDYRQRPLLNDTQTEESEEIHQSENSDSSEDDEEVSEVGQLYSRVQKKVDRSGSLCTAKFEQNALHISALPLELLLYILRWVVSTDLDLKSLETFGSVCRGFYLCARDSEIWRLTCLRIWGLNCGPTPGEYKSWRNMFIERPRLNFNGCYISKTTYIRHGENSFQDQFYRPWHLVTYYRYLRFFPEGVVLMLTSPDDPVQCIAQMKSKQPRQPVMIGYYRLRDNKVTLVIQRQEASKAMQTTFRKGSRKREIDNSEQTFHMELDIQNHKNRRHVKLVWTYYSVFTKSKQGHESTCNFDLKTNRFPPLWFSRVKSFTAESDQPLT